ncbi:hypothetical protein H9L39_02951 [Fusarium oxysporum f. sp. albedinis]|nr:hypothetical protein H9L39_02951 [Fusarium oxysporum f. sp. albedinis]
MLAPLVLLYQIWYGFIAKISQSLLIKPPIPKDLVSTSFLRYFKTGGIVSAIIHVNNMSIYSAFNTVLSFDVGESP